MAEGMADAFAGQWPQRFALFGHSFGALLAYELARVLKQRNQPMPLRLFVAGARAPHLPLKERIHGLSDKLFLAKLRQYDGLPDELLQHPDLISAVLPIIKGDFRLFERHKFKKSDPLEIPLSVFGGLADSNVSVPELLAWSRQTSKAFRSRFLKGSHFFLFESVSSMAGYIQQDLAACSPDTGAEVA
jgi:surfactin synthase thioesterase subunit